jgi:hypothetical protein
MTEPTDERIAAAEHALREFARVAGGTEKARSERHADILARILRESHGSPLRHRALESPEVVDALLDGTDALRWKADGERQSVERAAADGQDTAQREAKAARYEAHADAILHLDREIGV